MPTPAGSLRTWLSKKDTVTLKELDRQLTCNRKELVLLISKILNKPKFPDDVRISTQLLREQYDKLKPYLPQTIDDHATMREKANAARPPKRPAAKREESYKEGEMLPEVGRKGFFPAGITQ